MSTPPDDWDQDERQMRSKLDVEIEAIRKRHANDPPRDVLVAARAGLLPAEMQARASAHLERDAWSRAIVEGFEQSGADEGVDPGFEERLLANIQKSPSTLIMPNKWRRTLAATGGLALAATILIAVFVSRKPADLAPSSSPASPASSTAVVPSPAPPPAPITFTKPDVKWSAGALTWRGVPADQPFMADLTPAMDAYREGDYTRAEPAFDRLSGKYPDSIEVLFYLGLTRMLRDDFAGALAPLAAAEQLKQVTFADDVSWFLGVAELRTGQVVQSRSRLSALCGKGGSRAAEACAAVAKLDADTSPVPSKTR